MRTRIAHLVTAAFLSLFALAVSGCRARKAATLAAGLRPGLLNGVFVITGNTLALSKDAAGKIRHEEKPFLAIPYYAWANRGPGQMLVWLPRTSAAEKPAKSVNMKVV